MQTDLTVQSNGAGWETLPADPKARVLAFLNFSSYLTTRIVSTSLRTLADENTRYWSSRFTMRFGNFEQLMTNIENMVEFSPYLEPSHTNYFQIYQLALQKMYGFSKFHLPDPNLIVCGNFKQLALMSPPCQKESSFFLIDESFWVKKINPRHFFSSNQATTIDWYTSFKMSEQPTCIFSCDDMLFVGTQNGNVFVYKISDDQGKSVLDQISMISLEAKIESIDGSSKDGKVGLVIVSKDPATNGSKASIFLLDASSPPKVKKISPEQPQMVSGPFFGKDLFLVCPLQAGGIIFYDLDMVTDDTQIMKQTLHIPQTFVIKYLLRLRDHLIFSTYDGRLGWIEPAKPEQEPKWLKKPFFADIVNLTPVKQMGFCLHGENGERVVFLRQPNDSYYCGSGLTRHMEDPQWMENGKVIYRFKKDETENGLYLTDFSQTWLEEFLSKLQKKISPKSN